MHTVSSADGVRVAFEVYGDATPAVLLVHGWSCDRTYWRQQVDQLSADHTVVTLDLAGHGASGADRSTWTLPAFGGDVMAVVDQVGLDDVVLVGHSFGGDVVMEAAVSLGDRVRAAVMVETYRSLDDTRPAPDPDELLRPFQDDFAAATQRLVRGMFPPTTPQALVDQIADDMSAAPPEVAVPTLRVAMTCLPLVLDRIAQLRAPVLAINAGYKPTDEAGFRAHGVQPTIVPDVGHFVMLEDPAAFNQALRRSLARLEANGST